ncbi:MAG: signal peptidase I [Chloroflexi bacterium]|nr:signal peptidase I [Chloroflexota bacterium]
MRKTLNAFFWLLPLVGMVGGAYFVPQLLKGVLDSDTPTAVVISRSMWPALNRGDLVLIQGTTREEIQVGTILVFHHNNGISIHRVIRMDGDTIVTKGDANNTEDPPITFADVVGRNPVWFGGPAKLPLVGQLALLMGPAEVAVSQNGERAPGPPSFVNLLVSYTKSPLGLGIMVLIPVLLLSTVLFGEASTRMRGGRRLSRLHQRRLERLRRRWPHARLA